jgi:hypothetical protein
MRRKLKSEDSRASTAIVAVFRFGLSQIAGGDRADADAPLHPFGSRVVTNEACQRSLIYASVFHGSSASKLPRSVTPKMISLEKDCALAYVTALSVMPGEFCVERKSHQVTEGVRICLNEESSLQCLECQSQPPSLGGERWRTVASR